MEVTEYIDIIGIHNSVITPSDKFIKHNLPEARFPSFTIARRELQYGEAVSPVIFNSFAIGTTRMLLAGFAKSILTIPLAFQGIYP
jgi:hypothetical protein